MCMYVVCGMYVCALILRYTWPVQIRQNTTNNKVNFVATERDFQYFPFRQFISSIQYPQLHAYKCT